MKYKLLIFLPVTLSLIAAAPMAAGAVTLNQENIPVLGTAVASVSVVARQLAPTVSARTVKGTWKTKRYLPKSFKYTLKVPTLKNVTAPVKKAFDKRIDKLIVRQLAHYAKGAITKSQFLDNFEDQSVSMSDYRKSCLYGFENLTGKFTASLHQGRYVSVVVTFGGSNGACVGIGGLMPGYQTNRSVTIDTTTGRFMQPSDFTSNTKGQVNAALKAWYATARDLSSVGRALPLPKVAKTIKVCDQPGNVRAPWSKQQKCQSWRTTPKTDLVSWQVSDKGLRLTFLDGKRGLRTAVLPWNKIPQTK